MTTDPAGSIFPDLLNTTELSLEFLELATGEIVSAVPQAAPPDTKPSFILLRELLQSLPINERLLIIDGLDDAIRKGILKAVPIEGPAFAVSVPRAGRKRGRRLVREHCIRDTPEALAWVTRQRAEARYRDLEATGRVSSTVERLAVQLDDFDRLAELHRQTLRRRRPHGE